MDAIRTRVGKPRTTRESTCRSWRIRPLRRAERVWACGKHWLTWGRPLRKILAGRFRMGRVFWGSWAEHKLLAAMEEKNYAEDTESTEFTEKRNATGDVERGLCRDPSAACRIKRGTPVPPPAGTRDDSFGERELLAGGGGSGGLRGVVAVARACDELAFAAGRKNVHVNAAEAAIAGNVQGVIAQSVLVANVVGHLFTNTVNIFDVFREIGDAAGSGSDFGQGFLGGFGAAFAFLAEQADGIDDSIGFLNLANGFLE